jgi:glycosyltransferase involved in cell wall biosynthesis
MAGADAPRLLAINNYFYRRGGSEVVFFEHNRLFEEAGWEVVPFAMRSAQDLPSVWSRHFVEPVEFGDEQPLVRKLVAAGKIIYSLEARRRIRELCALTRPSIAHAHNIYHHLSPSILGELRSHGIPVVMTLHDLKLACPAYKMFTNGAVCESCRDGKLRNVMKRRCIKGSLAMSALVWLESTLHRQLDLFTKNVTQFVVPSRFLLGKLTEWGLNPELFTYIPNFVATEEHTAASVGNHFVYIGRLVPEKGVATLIRAAARAAVALQIVGTGSEEESLKRLAAAAGGDVTFSGYLEGEQLRQALLSARAIVVPSEWYENAPISVMEASGSGKVTIGARIGGIPELIREGETGFLFEAGNVEALAEVLRQVHTLPDATLAKMGAAAHSWMRGEFTPTHYRERMLSLYNRLGVAA